MSLSRQGLEYAVFPAEMYDHETASDGAVPVLEI